jgi:hypothetical protein
MKDKYQWEYAFCIAVPVLSVKLKKKFFALAWNITSIPWLLNL